MQDMHHEPALTDSAADTGRAETETPATAGASTPEVMPSLEESLKKAELAAQEHHEAWLRAKAEADNIRKRAQIDVANAHKYAIESFSTALLDVKDSLEAALAANNATMESLRDGVELTLKQLNSVFERFRLTEINPVGQKFDPHRIKRLPPSNRTPRRTLSYGFYKRATFSRPGNPSGDGDGL